jgi:hypothetical protein
LRKQNGACCRRSRHSGHWPIVIARWVSSRIRARTIPGSPSPRAPRPARGRRASPLSRRASRAGPDLVDLPMPEVAHERPARLECDRVELVPEVLERGVAIAERVDDPYPGCRRRPPRGPAPRRGTGCAAAPRHPGSAGAHPGPPVPTPARGFPLRPRARLPAPSPSVWPSWIRPEVKTRVASTTCSVAGLGEPVGTTRFWTPRGAPRGRKAS